MNKIVVASDSFKGTLSSKEICQLFIDEFKDRKDLDLITIPIADGGEGSLEAISSSIKGKYISHPTRVMDKKIKMSSYFLSDDNTAYIEVNKTCSFTSNNKIKDTGLLSSIGVGKQIKHAIIHNHVKKIYVCLGGSKTTDAGVGMLSSLGVIFYNKNKKEFIPNGYTLNYIYNLDTSKMDKLLKDVEIVGLCDVDNPLYGDNGSPVIFGPQKGADEKKIRLLDENFKYFADFINRTRNIDIANIKGSGAAGGIGAGLLLTNRCKLINGANKILEIVDFKNKIEGASYLITGEGRLDNQTLNGKLVSSVLNNVDNKNVKIILIAGSSNIKKEELNPNIDIIETNYNHLPFDKIKNDAQKMYIEAIRRLKREI